MKMNTRKLLSLLLSAGIPLACSGSGPATTGGTQTISGSKLSDYAASWDGYAEAYTFMPSGSDRVRLTIDANGNGTLQVGDGTLFPPPTDPNVGYPPGADAGFGGNNFVLGEGILYPIYAPQVQTARIQVGVKPNDFYGAWCALQTPVATSSKLILLGTDGGSGGAGGDYMGGGYVTVPAAIDAGGVTTSYNCLPNWGGDQSTNDAGTTCSVTTDPTTQAYEQVDCGRYFLCLMQVCGCTASGCVASPLLPADATASQYPVELDAALDSTGTTLTGTLTLSPDRVTVHLQKK